MEILPNVHRIESQFNQRRFTSYLLLGEVALLFDSGFAFTPEKTLFPYFEQVGFNQERLAWLVISHASADHFGGNHAVRSRCPKVKTVAHHLDAPAIENHQAFLREHKQWPQAYGLPRQEVSKKDFERYFGPETAVDLAVTDGGWISLSSDWSVQLLHTPGHTPGHLIIYDPRHRAAYIGDAILGSGVPAVDGQIVMPPHYFEVDWYLQTIERIRNLDVDYLFGTHYPPLAHADVTAFLQKSHTFVETSSDILLAVLQEHPELPSTPELVTGMREKLGIAAAENQYQLLVRAHLNQLSKQKRVAHIVQGDLHLWELQR